MRLGLFDGWSATSGGRTPSRVHRVQVSIRISGSSSVPSRRSLVSQAAHRPRRSATGTSHPHRATPSTRWATDRQLRPVSLRRGRPREGRDEEHQHLHHHQREGTPTERAGAGVPYGRPVQLSTDARGTITTACRSCSDNFGRLWAKIRKSQQMIVSLSDGRSATFVLNGAAKALPLQHCTTGFES